MSGRRWLFGVLATVVAVGVPAAMPAQAVTGGTPVADGTYQFVAKIDVGDKASCTGALVDSQWVVTATSCFGADVVAGPPTRPTKATIGRAKLSGTAGHVVAVVEISPRADRNLVLAKLAEPVTDIAPVALAATGPAPGEALRIGGYGRTAVQWVPDNLHTALVTAQAVRGSLVDITSTSGVTTCRGDSGGPAFRESGGRPELLAIHNTSWQFGCLAETETRQGATETRVDDIGTWIRRQTTRNLTRPEENLARTKNVTASSTDPDPADGWSTQGAVDGQRVSIPANRGWSSIDRATENHTEWVQVDLAQSQVLGRVDLFARSDGADTGSGFPVDFDIQVSEDGVNWVTPVSRKGYGRPGAEAQSFGLAGSVGRYVKVTGTNLRKDSFGGHYFQLAEIEVYGATLSTGKTVTASSTDPDPADGWSTQGAVDGRRVSTPAVRGWSSISLAAVNHTEWVQVDLGQARPLGRVDLFARSDGADTGSGFPVDFDIQVSEDGVNWVTPVSRKGYGRPGAEAQSFGLAGRVGRYVKVTGTSLRPDPAGNYYFQLGEIDVHGANLATGKPVTASSTDPDPADGWTTVGAVDGQRVSTPAFRGWSSISLAAVNHTEWVQVDLGQSQSLGRVDLFARSDGAETGNGFPVGFTVQLSDDGTNWRNVVTQNGYPRPDASAQSFPLAGAGGRFVRVTGTNLRPDLSGSYYFQLSEIEVYGANLATGKPVTASSTDPDPADGWTTQGAVDGRRVSTPANRGWSSISLAAVNHTEWVQVDLGQAQQVNRVDVVPRTDDIETGNGFPVDFAIQLSADGSAWTTVAGRTGYPRPTSEAQTVLLGGQSTRYIRLLGTSLRKDAGGTYYMQLAEIEVS